MIQLKIFFLYHSLRFFLFRKLTVLSVWQDLFTLNFLPFFLLNQVVQYSFFSFSFESLTALSVPFATFYHAPTMIWISAGDVSYIAQALEASEGSHIKKMYLRMNPASTHQEGGSDEEDVFCLRPYVEKGEEPWTLHRLLQVSRVIQCDERALWEHLGLQFLDSFAEVNAFDLWTEQKAVKWAKTFLCWRHGGKEDFSPCANLPLLQELFDHIAVHIKPQAPLGWKPREEETTVAPEARENGVIEVVAMEGRKEGLVRCTAPASPFSPLIRVPYSKLFCRPTVNEFSPLAKIIQQLPQLQFIHEEEETLLVLCLVYEKYVVGAESSHWRDLLKGCPPCYPLVPSFWGFDALSELEGLDVLDDVIKKRGELDAFCHAVKETVVPAVWEALVSCPPAEGLPMKASLEEAFSFDALHWARATFDSRAFYVNFEGDTILLLTPVADMINHCNRSDILVRRIVSSPPGASEKCYFVMETGAALTTADLYRELWMSYGPLQNWELLQHYGFVLSESMYDILPFPLTFSQCVGDENEVVCGATNHDWHQLRLQLMEHWHLCSLQRCWIAASGVPSPALLALLRLQFASAEEMNRWAHWAEEKNKECGLSTAVSTPFSPQSNETEQTVLSAVKKTVEAVLSAFPTTLEEDLDGLSHIAEEPIDTEEDEDEKLWQARYALALRLRVGLKEIGHRCLEWCKTQAEVLEGEKSAP